eukprot:6141289-Ditylum_brightwellii.AAC.1
MEQKAKFDIAMVPNCANGTVDDNNDVMEVKKSYINMENIESPHWCKAHCIINTHQSHTNTATITSP